MSKVDGTSVLHPGHTLTNPALTTPSNAIQPAPNIAYKPFQVSRPDPQQLQPCVTPVPTAQQTSEVLQPSINHIPEQFTTFTVPNNHPQPVGHLEQQQLQQNMILPSAAVEQNSANAQLYSHHPPGQPTTFNVQSQQVGYPQEHQLQSATQNTTVNMSASAQLPAPYPPSQM